MNIFEGAGFSGSFFHTFHLPAYNKDIDCLIDQYENSS